MDSATLFNVNVEAGSNLVRELDARDKSPETAAWIYFTDRDQWRLLLQFDELRDKHATLVEIARILGARDDIAQGISMGQVAVVGPADDLASAIKSVIHTGPGVSYQSIGPSFVLGNYIEKGFVYRARDKSIQALQ